MRLEDPRLGGDQADIKDGVGQTIKICQVARIFVSPHVDIAVDC